MKRSRINAIMAEAGEMIRRHGFVLPPFAGWTPEEFRARRDIARNVIDARCGWDITDYGAGRYDEMGLFLFTLRNGRLADLQRGGGMCYAEKLLISRQDQLSPMHTHALKARTSSTAAAPRWSSSFTARTRAAASPETGAAPSIATASAAISLPARSCAWRPAKASP